MKFGDKIKETLNMKFHSKPVYDEQYIKVKVREFNGVIKTNFLIDEVPQENEHYTCIACIIIDSVMRMEKKNYRQVYLEECKYRMKKTLSWYLIILITATDTCNCVHNILRLFDGWVNFSFTTNQTKSDY